MLLEVDLDALKAELILGMNVAHGDQVILTFKRGDRCTVPHAANDGMLGDEDYYHVRVNRNQLNRLR